MSGDLMKIDIEQVLKDKAPNIKVPSFVVKYLKRIAHQDELNNFFSTHPEVRNVQFMEAALEHLQVKVEVIGKENLPTQGRYIIASNHPLGGLDGMAITAAIGKEFNDKVLFFANDLLLNLQQAKDIFIPINKVGNQGKSNAELAKNAYESDNQILTFPAGLCSRKIKGEIIDLEWKKSFITNSIRYQRDIIPLHFEGKNSNFFYNLANFRKAIGIKFNIEMLYLSDEMYNQKGNKFKIRIGKPIPWQTLDKSKTPLEWAQWVREISYSLKKQ
jgi:putative hemolysin